MSSSPSSPAHSASSSAASSSPSTSSWGTPPPPSTTSRPSPHTYRASRWVLVDISGHLYLLFRGYWVVTSWLPGWLRFLTRAVIELESQLLGAILTTKMLMQSYVLILNSHIEIPTWCCKHYPAVSPNHQIWNNFNFCFIWKNFKNHNKEGRIKGSSFAENCSGDTLLERFFKRK